jgi:hypothetical protein
MKKKVRNITVGGVLYTWLCDWEGYRIFRDRKPWIYVNDDGMITPKMIANKIKQQLENETNTITSGN